MISFFYAKLHFSNKSVFDHPYDKTVPEKVITINK
jgi:hypothetical protein